MHILVSCNLVDDHSAVIHTSISSCLEIGVTILKLYDKHSIFLSLFDSIEI